MGPAAEAGRCGEAVPPGLTGPDRDRQDHELAALTRLTHPGLVKLYDAGTDHGWTYLVMPLVQGQSLADRLRDVALPVATVAKMGAQLADALAYVHAHGVTHRDIKPTHVLLDEQDHPLLTDFGIALLVDVTRVTLTGGVIGTAPYMAPEQVRGELVGPSADVYSSAWSCSRRSPAAANTPEPAWRAPEPGCTGLRLCPKTCRPGSPRRCVG